MRWCRSTAISCGVEPASVSERVKSRCGKLRIPDKVIIQSKSVTSKPRFPTRYGILCEPSGRGHTTVTVPVRRPRQSFQSKPERRKPRQVSMMMGCSRHMARRFIVCGENKLNQKTTRQTRSMWTSQTSDARQALQMGVPSPKQAVLLHLCNPVLSVFEDPAVQCRIWWSTVATSKSNNDVCCSSFILEHSQRYKK